MMSDIFVSEVPLPEFWLWGKIKDKGSLLAFDLEITARCNNNCRHCYINLSGKDKVAYEKELSFNQIKKIVDEAVSLGAIWCLITGGEPLLREDFFEIYLYLKKAGLLVSVFTNATLITDRHTEFFKRYPPRDIEVTVYGVTQETYEKVTRTPGLFRAFMQGVELLLGNGIRVRFKTMALRSNLSELPEIAGFCRQRTKDYFRFDPFLHLRFDQNAERNVEIRAERLYAKEIVDIENSDGERFQAMLRNCDKLIMPEARQFNCNHLFHCGAGKGSFSISYDGILRLCSSLWHPECTYDLKKGNLLDGWQDLVLRVRDMRSDREEFLKQCHQCPLVNLCMWCPAHSHLETGELDNPVEYFCEVAQARAKSLEKHKNT